MDGAGYGGSVVKNAVTIGCLAFVAFAGTWLLMRGRPARGIRLIIQTLSTDGPLPQPVYARRLDVEGDRIRLEKVRDEPPTFLIPNAQAGQYDFFNDEGWRFINPGAMLQTFDPKNEPATIAMGRPYCAYVRGDPRTDFRIQSIVGVERIEGNRREGIRYVPVDDAQVVTHEGGWMAVRFPPDACQPGTDFRLTGLLDGDHPYNPIKVRVGVQPRRPYIAYAVPASVGRLQVALVGRKPERTIDVEVLAAFRGLPLGMTARARTLQGVATFPALGAFPQGLEVSVPEFGPGASYLMGLDRWRREGTVFLRALDADAVWVDVLPPEGVSVDNVSVWDRAADRFGLVPLERGEPLRVRVPKGPQHWIVYAKGKAHAFGVDVTEGMRVTVPPMDDVVRVHGDLKVARTGYRVQFFRKMDDDTWIGGHGFDVDGSIGKDYEARIPAGTYRVRVTQPGGRSGKPLTLTWLPGANVELPLDAR